MRTIDLDAILADAVTRFTEITGQPVIASDLEWEAWSQGWPSTALGYGGIGGQMMTSAQTVIVFRQRLCREVCVYFGGRRLAYVARTDAPGWEDAYASRRMPPVGRSAPVRVPRGG